MSYRRHSLTFRPGPHLRVNQSHLRSFSPIYLCIYLICDVARSADKWSALHRRGEGLLSSFSGDIGASPPSLFTHVPYPPSQPRTKLAVPSSVGRGTSTRERGRSRANHPRPGGRHHRTEPRLVGLITAGDRPCFFFFFPSLWPWFVFITDVSRRIIFTTTFASHSREAVERP